MVWTRGLIQILIRVYHFAKCLKIDQKVSVAQHWDHPMALAVQFVSLNFGDEEENSFIHAFIRDTVRSFAQSGVCFGAKCRSKIFRNFFHQMHQIHYVRLFKTVRL